jgi:hypothetical protein
VSDDLDRVFYEVFGGNGFTGQQKRHRVTPEMEQAILEIAAKAETEEAKGSAEG